MAATEDDVIASWRDRVGMLRKRSRIGAAALAVVAATEIDVRHGRPPAPERLSDEERDLWERLTFSRRPGWFSGAEAILESYVTTALQMQRLEAALRKAKPGAAALPKAGAPAPAVGRPGGHAGDTAAVDAIVEARQAHAYGRRATRSR